MARAQCGQLFQASIGATEKYSNQAPFIVGGESDAALRRVAELGQGWFGYNLTSERLSERLQRLSSLIAEAGRERSDIEVYASSRDRLDSDALERFRALGVDQLIRPLFARDADKLRARADALAEATLG